MEISEWLTVLSEMAVFVAAAIVYLRGKESRKKGTRTKFMLVGVSFLVVAIATILFSFEETILLRTLQTIFWAVVMNLAISEMTRLSQLKYLNLILAFSAVSITGSINIETISLFLSLLMASMSFIVLVMFTGSYLRHGGILGFVGTLTGILLLITSRDIAAAYSYWFIPGLFLAISILSAAHVDVNFHRVKPHETKRINAGKEKRQGEAWSALMHLLVYVVITNLSIILAVVGLHELGHFLVGRELGCTGQAVFIDTLKTGPYTALSCPQGVPQNILALGGALLVLPFGLIFFLLRKYPERNFGFVIYGLGMIMSALDFSVAFAMASVLYVSIVAGILFIVVGEALLINTYIEYSALENDEQKERDNAEQQPEP